MNENQNATSLWAESPTRPAGFRQTLKVGDAEYGFRWIPAGEFEMGTAPETEDWPHDATLHHVTLTRGFWLLETPVPQRFYLSLMKTNPSHFAWDGLPLIGVDYDLPVETVSYYDALKFCQILTSLLPTGVTATLPTEAQWEYACRAGSRTAYWFGRSLNGDKANCCGIRPYKKRSGTYLEMTSPVAKFPANPWGVYDMHGNVEEWQLDFYDEYPAESVVDPTGPRVGLCRVVRGGGWDSPAAFCCSTSRNCFPPDTVSSSVGFRVLLSCD